MTVRSETIEDETMTSEDDVRGADSLGAGIPEDWWTIRRWAGAYGHGDSDSAARNFFYRERSAGRITTWREPFGPRGGRYLDAEQRSQHRDRLLEQSTRSRPDDADA